jgi:List-Bact-rpt repeat protein
VAGALWAAPGALAAGWCGSGETDVDRADAMTGPQVHAIWAVPADGADTFAAGAARLADDLASLDSWWATQDPTRAPRIDNAVFPGGTCADISFVRLPLPAAAYAGAGTAFTEVSYEIATSGFANAFKKYVVYFDGPSVEANVCGTGSGAFGTGPSYAVVWLGGCPSVPGDAIAAHELLHALGALPDGAPHACPDGSGHPCDSPQDVLYPYSSGAPLAQLVLDWNHDDYYAHSGTWSDIQDSSWLHLLNAPTFPLSVAIAGSGSVSSDVPGLYCTTSCTTRWDGGSKVMLTPAPGRRARFVGWSGPCAGRQECSVSIGAATAVTATFGPQRVAVKVGANGKGRVRCTPACGKTVAAGERLTLRASAATGWKFLRWTGDCAAVRGPTCRPKTDFHVTVRATFRKR